MNRKHSKYPPSSAYRWLHCPASVLLAPDEIERDTTAADEGTLAHRIAELKLTRDFWNDNEEELKECRGDLLYKLEMEEYTDNYYEYIKALENSESKVFIETKLDMGNYMPELFGTCDCIVYDTLYNKLHIVDFKYGFGKVQASNNPQLRFYALGAIDFIKAKYPNVNTDEIDVNMTIYQPRIRNIVCESITAKKLKAWIKEQKPSIKKIIDGITERNTGDWCKWCDRQIHCRDYQQDLTNCYIEDFFSLTDSEIAENLEKLSEVEKMLKKLKAYAVEQIQNGKEFPGYKLREINKKSWDDEETVKDIAKEYELISVLSPNQALKKLGKKKFEELLGNHVTTTPSTPQLVKEKN